MMAKAREKADAARKTWPLLLCNVFDGVQYGDWFRETPFNTLAKHRLPFIMFMGMLQQDLLNYLLDSEPFNATSFNMPSLWKRFGVKNADKQGEPQEFAKADWHTTPDLPRQAEVFVPRLGCRGTALRAPVRVAAFAEAFRNVNEPVWHAALEQLRGLANGAREELQGLCDLFCDAIQRKKHFGAVEMQHYCGDGFSGRQHIDGVTSLLHLAISLGGERKLSFVSATSNTGADLQEELPMRSGDVYLSSPALFQHKVIYPQCQAHNSMISLHMRFLFEPCWWLKKYVNQVRDRETYDVAQAIVDALLSKPVRLPSCSEVEACESRLLAKEDAASY